MIDVNQGRFGRHGRHISGGLRSSLLALLLSVHTVIAFGADKVENIPASCPPGFNAYVLVTVEGLRDQKGNLRVEVYPDNEQDFLTNRLGRTQVPTPDGEPQLCVELPDRGRYAIVVHQDRNANNSLDLFKDGFGFANNPTLGLNVPDVDEVAIDAQGLLTRITVDMHYLFKGPARRPTGPRRH